MQIVDVVSVLNCGVTATLTMYVRVLGMFFVRHRWLPLKEDHCLWRIVQCQGSITLAPCQPDPKNNAETAETPVVVLKVKLGNNHGFAPHCQILQLVVLHSQALNKFKASKAFMNSFADRSRQVPEPRGGGDSFGSGRAKRYFPSASSLCGKPVACRPSRSHPDFAAISWERQFSGFPGDGRKKLGDRRRGTIGMPGTSASSATFLAGPKMAVPS